MEAVHTDSDRRSLQKTLCHYFGDLLNVGSRGQKSGPAAVLKNLGWGGNVTSLKAGGQPEPRIFRLREKFFN